MFNIFNRLPIIIIVILSFMQIHCNNTEKNSLTPDGEVIDAQTIIKQIQEGKSVHYLSKRIKGDLDFTTINNHYLEMPTVIRTDINVGITFISCIFDGKVTAYRQKDNITYMCNFNKNLTFVDAVFNAGIDLREADVMGITSFNKSRFTTETQLQGLRMRGKNNYFTYTLFQSDAQLQGLFCDGNLNFLNAVFEKNTSFQGLRCAGLANFSAAKFNAYADFTNSSINDGLLFHYAQFLASFDLSYSKIGGRLEYTSATIAQKADMSNIYAAGNVGLDKLTVSGQVLFEKAFFALGKPDTTSVVLQQNGSIDWGKVK